MNNKYIWILLLISFISGCSSNDPKVAETQDEVVIEEPKKVVGVVKEFIPEHILNSSIEVVPH